MPGGVTGIFVMVELAGALGDWVREVQQRVDPRFAREAAPHVTLIGSSGAGPISAEVPVAQVAESLTAVARRHQPFSVPFGAPERLGERTVMALPLSPHGVLRTLHEALRACGLPMATSRWPFTPHCTISFYPELSREQMRELMRLRAPEPMPVEQLAVYHTKATGADLLLTIPLGG